MATLDWEWYTSLVPYTAPPLVEPVTFTSITVPAWTAATATLDPAAYTSVPVTLLLLEPVMLSLNTSPADRTQVRSAVVVPST
jgi:hypothetical protein